MEKAESNDVSSHDCCRKGWLRVFNPSTFALGSRYKVLFRGSSLVPVKSVLMKNVLMKNNGLDSMDKVL
jgi:hypothetical protein